MGEKYAPPFPPGDAFAVHFIGNDIGLPSMEPQLHDYRNGTTTTNGTRTHEIEFQAEAGDQLTIAWNLPLGITGRLVDVVTSGAHCNVAMAGAGSYIETNMAVDRFTITVTYALTPLKVPIKVFLEGPYNTGLGKMNTGLRTGGHLATRFSGVAIPYEAVDSVTVEIRDSLSGSAATVRQLAGAWLLSNGTLRASSDTTKSYVEFPYTIEGGFYLVIRHRNHLAVMTKNIVALTAETAQYDFTTGQDKAHGTNTLKALSGDTVFALFAADANGSGDVSILDRSAWRTQNSQAGYLGADFNLSGDVSILDRALWRANNSLASQVP